MSRLAVLGANVDRLTTNELVALVERAVNEGRQLRVAHHNLHSVYLFHKSREMRRWYDAADLIYADGMSLVLVARLRGQDLRSEHRTTLLDCVDDLFARAHRGRWRVFLLGGRPGVAARCAATLGSRFASIEWGVADGYFDVEPESTESSAVLGRINEFAPDLLMVGMGMPRQEAWLSEHHSAISATVMWSVGGLFDYIAGQTRTPPRWMGRVGLEWLFRLASDPRRLAFRYVIEPILLLADLARKRAR